MIIPITSPPPSHRDRNGAGLLSLPKVKEEESRNITNNITRNIAYIFIFLIWVLLERKPWDKNSNAEVIYLRSVGSTGKGDGKKEREGRVTGG